MKKLIICFGIIIVITLVWSILGNYNNVIKLLISTPYETFKYFIKDINELAYASFLTFTEAFIGLLIATIFSFIVMIIGLYSKKILEILMPFMMISQIVPTITIAPLIILIFGTGIYGKIIISAIISFFPIFMNFYKGITRIQTEILDILKVYNATLNFKIKRIYFPLAIPYIIIGLKISSLLAVIGAIVGEFNGADAGLGKNLFLAAKKIEPELMITSLILSSLIGIILYLLIKLIEIKFGHWYINENKY